METSVQELERKEVERRNAATWRARLAPYIAPDLKRSVLQLVSAAILFAGAWALMYASLAASYWLTLALAVPTAFLLIRLFIIQHDCGHGAFFRSSRAAEIVGSIIGVLTLTPYHYWKKTHAMHHATTGNLEHRGFGDIKTLTVDEFLALPRWGRFKYRVYRNPVVLFGVGAVVHFFILHRIPAIVPKTWTRERRSILWTDVGLLAFIVPHGHIARVPGGVARATSRGAAVNGHRGVVVLRTAPVRADLLGARREVGVRRCGVDRKLVLPTPQGLAVGDRQHRPASHPSSECPDPELPPSRRDGLQS